MRALHACARVCVDGMLVLQSFSVVGMHDTAVPYVCQYLWEFDAPAMHSCKPLPCGTSS